MPPRTLIARLPLRFDAERLRCEIQSLPAETWTRRYADRAGTAVIALTQPAPDGAESLAPILDHLPAVAETLAAFGVALGAPLLLRLGPGGGFPGLGRTVYRENRPQILVPIAVSADFRLVCGTTPFPLTAGEAYALDAIVPRRLINDTVETGLFLLFDIAAEGFAALTGLQWPTRAPLMLLPPVAGQVLPVFDRPIFIVSAPRSGSTLLFELLATSSSFWTLGGEGHHHIENIAALVPQEGGLDSNRLTAAHAPAAAAQLVTSYGTDLRDSGGHLWQAAKAPATVRFLEKTPKNALRIPFLKAVFPDAKFIFLHREAQANIGSIVDAWQSGRFVTYTNLPGWRLLTWSLLLIPAWRETIGHSLAEIALRQWRDTNEIILDDLAGLDRADWCAVAYDELIADPAACIGRLCAFAGVAMEDALARAAAGPLRPSRYTLSAPDPAKWRRHESLIAPLLGEIAAVQSRLATLG